MMTQSIPYPLALLKAAHRGASSGNALFVTFVDKGGAVAQGSVIGIGSKLSISTGGTLVEDVAPEAVTAATVVAWSSR